MELVKHGYSREVVHLSRSPVTLYGPIYSSHGGVKVKMKYMLQIYIAPSVDWYQYWRIRRESEQKLLPNKHQ